MSYSPPAFTVAANAAARDALAAAGPTIGMSVHTLDDNQVWELKEYHPGATTLFTDGFESYTQGLPPGGIWNLAGSTGAGSALVKGVVTITSPAPAVGTTTPQAGSNQLFLGSLTGTVLGAINGRTKASINLDLSLLTGTIPLTFYARTIGSGDSISFDGFDLDILDTGGPAPPVGNSQPVHQSIANQAYTLYTVYLNAYAGRTITLVWSVYDDSAVGDPAAIAIDSVLVLPPTFVWVNVSPNWKLTSVKTANYTADYNELVLLNATSAFTLFLPDARVQPGGRVALKKVTSGAFALTLAPSVFTQLIDGVSSLNLNGIRQGQVYFSDGTGWFLLAKN